MFLAGRPTHERLLAIFTASQEAALTYAFAGATRTRVEPAGFRHDTYAMPLGDADVWDRAIGGLRGWVAHAGAGAEVFPGGAPLIEGGTVLVSLSTGPVWVVAPCRIVYVVEEADRFGFAYGTLPGHPEQGEEAFIVESAADGRVMFRITAFSRPAGTVAKLGDPVTRMIQRRVTTKYLSALRDYVKRDG